MFRRYSISAKALACSIAFSFLILAGCSEPVTSEGEAPLRPVRTIVAGDVDATSRRSFSGVVDANQKATLSFRVTGKLETIDVKEGDEIAQGTTLATLDDSDFQIQLSEAEATFSRASADFERAKQLVERGHVSKADFDKLKATEASARASLESAHQKVDYSTLKAPFSGLVAKRYVENFQEVKASQAILLLQDLSSLEIKVDIPSSVMVNADREQGQLDIVAEFDVIPNRKFPLSVKEVSTLADDVTQTYTVTLTMENIEGYLILPGMTATVTATPKRQSINEPVVLDIVLPSSSVLGTGTDAYVWILEPDVEDAAVGTIRRAGVQIGEVLPKGLQILSGVEQGQRVVTAGMSQLSDGQRVRVLKGQ